MTARGLRVASGAVRGEARRGVDPPTRKQHASSLDAGRGGGARRSSRRDPSVEGAARHFPEDVADRKKLLPRMRGIEYWKSKRRRHGSHGGFV